MAYQIVLKISYPSYRVQGEQSASMQLRLLGIPSLQSHAKRLPQSSSTWPCAYRNRGVQWACLANFLPATHLGD